MQFEHAHMLVLLFALPGLYILYLRYNAGRKESVLRFSSIETVTRAVAGRQGAWRRHLPFALMAAAVAMAAVAMADLQVPVVAADVSPDTRNGRSISIVLDVSESMSATDYAPSRLDAAKQSITGLIQGSDPRDYVGVILFETGATTASYLTDNKQKASEAVMSIGQSGGATAIGDGLALGVDMAISIPDRRGVVILLSDGVHNSGQITPQEAVEYAQRAGVQVHTVGIGSAEPAFVKNDVFGQPQYAELDEETLAYIANATGGRFSKSLDEQALGGTLAEIGAALGGEVGYQSVSDWFVASSLALLASAMYTIYGRYRIIA